MPRPISATISLPSLSHNLSLVAQQLHQPAAPAGGRGPRIWAVIKANAYGHGIERAVQAFSQADGLAMLDLNEAVRCRELGWNRPILLLEGFFEEGDIPVLERYRLTTVLHCQEQLDMLAAAPPLRPLDAFVKLNVGMNRLGFSEEAYASAYQQALAARERGILADVGQMCHFSRADDDAQVTAKELDSFIRLAGGQAGRISVCNSAATFTPGLWSRLPASQEQWLRPGICLYGASPFADRTAASMGLRPAMTLASRLISVRDITAGACVGYGGTFSCSGSMRIGVVACGYADGYPRHAGTGTPITVGGVRTRLLGRVSMDMLAVDLTPVPHARVGTDAILWGEGGPSVDEVAQAAGTIGYELLCALAPRVPVVTIE